MLAILTAILPVFALIGAGILFGRWRRVGRDGIAMLNDFTVSLALPALLFRSLAEGDWAELNRPSFLLIFAGGIAITFIMGLLLPPPSDAEHPLVDRSLTALTSSYPNAGFIGIPLAQGLLGPVGLAAGVIAAILTISFQFAISLLLVEIGLARGGSLRDSGVKVVRALARNPLVLSPIAGGLWALTGIPLPGMAARFVDLLAAAASPCALVTIGAFLALPRGDDRVPTPLLGPALAIKLVAQPTVMAAGVFWLAPALGVPMPYPWAVAAILLGALPTGTGPFMLAELYGRDAELASRVILLSTAIGTASVMLLAFLLVPR
ncbi:AEC family transporter [Sphingomonas sp.]|uniref:AEC family transporter n=1 Tax=Sphingomonas sp. TaxID=28214 RepID=UPI0025ECD1F8|nr:AEC family transporter [Sphingomonas sp.]